MQFILGFVVVVRALWTLARRETVGETARTSPDPPQREPSPADWRIFRLGLIGEAAIAAVLAAAVFAATMLLEARLAEVADIRENVRFLRQSMMDDAYDKPFGRLNFASASLVGLDLGCERDNPDLRRLKRYEMIPLATALAMGCADFRGANLSGAVLTDANLDGAIFSGANLSSAVFVRAQLSDRVNMSDAVLTDARLAESDLEQIFLERADLTSADLVRADLNGANLRDADLSRADLTEADLRFTLLNGADLTSADLVRANLDMASLVNANLSRADVTEADLRVADLRATVGLGSGELEGIRFDDATMWPSGFDIRSTLP